MDKMLPQGAGVKALSKKKKKNCLVVQELRCTVVHLEFYLVYLVSSECGCSPLSLSAAGCGELCGMLKKRYFIIMTVDTLIFCWIKILLTAWAHLCLGYRFYGSKWDGRAVPGFIRTCSAASSGQQPHCLLLQLHCCPATTAATAVCCTATVDSTESGKFLGNTERGCERLWVKIYVKMVLVCGSWVL